MIRGVLMTLCAAALVAGCGRSPGAGQGTDQAGGIRNAVARAAVARLTASQAPRAQALLRAGAPAQFSVLENTSNAGFVFLSQTSEQGIQTWLSLDGASMAFKDGMLVGTRGVQRGDLMSADVRESAALIHARRAGTAKRFHSYLNGENQIETRAYICDIVVDTPNFALVLGTSSYDTTYMVEHCHGVSEDFTSYYYVQPNGHIIGARQYVSARRGLLATMPVSSLNPLPTARAAGGQ